MSAVMHSVTANPRTESGKGAARRLRKSGQIPAVAYGKGLPATALAVAPKDIVSVLKSERGQNTVLQVKVDGASDLLVMIKDFSYHPVTRSLEHVDFIQVNLEEPVEADVPLVTTGRAAGMTFGGVLRQVYRTLPVRCVPDRIPLRIEADVTSLEVGDSLAVKDLALPEGVEVHLAPEQTVLSLAAPEKEREEEAEGEAGGEKKEAGKEAKKK